ncbi:MAG: acyl-CoA dehydrogenase family protein, partial [Pseudomonadales bacterium]
TTLPAAPTPPWSLAQYQAELIGRSGIFIGESAVQLHGGMGMTEELRVGHYFKRLLVIDTQFGNADHHLQRFAAS